MTKKELAELHIAHKQERNKRYAYRIHAIILLGTGYTLKKVKEVLFIDDETLRNYVGTYRNDGIPGLLSDNHNGKSCQLSHEQIDLLCKELETNIHLTTASVSHFVFQKFEVLYTATGMRDLLHRLDYVYKKPKLFPGKPDIEAQEIFAAQYDQFMESKPDDLAVVFVDAIHPEHNTLASLWLD